MKKIILLAQAFFFSFALYAQENSTFAVSKLPVIAISSSLSLHFLSPEKISYVDLSSTSLIGDLPEKNILRIKAIPDSIAALSAHGDAGIVTIVGESFIAQYKLIFLMDHSENQLSSQFEILPEHTRPLDFLAPGLSSTEMKANSISLLKYRGKGYISKASNAGISVYLKHIYTISDNVILDLRFENSTNLPFDLDEIRFKIEDKKINKSTNVQSVELFPIFSLYKFESFKKSFRNIYIFKKTTFPGNKVFNIQLTEKQISGRNVELPLHYSDILKADTF